jgi:SAM-dependent methyltransferase
MNPKQTLGLMAYRASEFYNDWRLGIQTKGLVVPADFGADGEGCHAYLALSYKSLRRVLGNVPVQADKDVFVDYGSGLGRVVAVAASMPYRKVHGVELSKGLHDVAVRNLQIAKPKLRCQNVELHNVDARAFAVPDDLSVIFFFMPFNADILTVVLNNILRSVQAAPRKVTILYMHPLGGVTLHHVLPKLPWLKLHSDTHVESNLHLMVASIDASKA